MKAFLLAAFCCLSIAHARQQTTHDSAPNPFFAEYATPFKTPPFSEITVAHYKPAILRGIEEQRKEVLAIVQNSELPTFLNTIDALERSGGLLEKVGNVFYAMRSSNDGDELQAIAVETAPLLSKLTDDIYLNRDLFKRVKSVYDGKKSLGLTPEQLMLLETTYKNFVRGGANLPPNREERFRKINEELSTLSLQYEDNVLKETNAFKLVIDNRDDLAGLPDAVIGGAAALAKQSGLEGKWVVTIQKPSMIPFLTYARNRDLRRKVYQAYTNKGDNGNGQDNNKIIARVAALRGERASMLGYATHADFALERSMAKKPSEVYGLLNKLWKPALAVARKERDEMQKMIRQEGNTFKLESWDWWYYAEKVRKAKYDLDDNELRPYFLMENVRKGVFDVASRLYGIQFIERTDIPRYDPDVTVFEVKRTDGSHVGILYTDYYPRASKHAGAWCGTFRRQEIKGGANVPPHVFNVGNFTKPAGDQPALLSLDDVETLFHEFGHALHSLLSNVTYSNLPIARDFVELPSQIMEHWAYEPEVLRSYARHYQTGEPIPQSLIDKITKSAKFNQGFATVEYLAASFLDMDWHTLKSTTPVDAGVFERRAMKKIGLMPEIVSRYRSTYFSHIVGHAYSAGYYSYIWAEVLDSDAFEAFKQKGIFDPATAHAFEKNILSKAGTEDPMSMYVNFRGKKPTIEPLLRKRGLL